jgi:nickel-dependent lactate racemase
MSSINVKVPAWEWHGWKTEELEFPDGWTVHEQRMAGHDAKALTPGEISESLEHPVGTRPLRELARGKRRCVILFDDMTRPTKTWQMLPAVLDELHAGGLEDDQIVFVMAPGSHGPRLLTDFQKKLGRDAPERFLVFNHNAYENLEYLGDTAQGTPVKINREVMSCDLKITIGSLMHHQSYGFGGGSKMLLPGVAGIDSIYPNHHLNEGTGPGRIQENTRRKDSEEASRMAGIDFVVNALLNADCDVARIFCGDVVEAHREGIKAARKHYVTEVIPDADISIGNGYPMADEAYKALHIARESVKPGGDLVFLIYTPEGCRIHYYKGQFGTDYGGRGWSPEPYIRKPWKMGRILCVSPEISKVDEGIYGLGSQWVKSWGEALSMLKERHGSDALVAIYPTASMQISEKNAGNT